MQNDRLVARVASLYGRADLSASDVLRSVVAAYREDGGPEVDPDALTEEDRHRLREYIRRAEMDTPAFSMHHKVPTLRRLPLYEDTASKVSALAKQQCLACPPGDEFPPDHFPIEVPPWSHQCSPKVGPALRAAIDSSEHYTSHFARRRARGPVCLRLVFVLGDGASMKDCDNMAKGVLDAFEGLLYVNDKQVEHLDLIKLHHAPGSGGYIIVRRASTRVNDHGDVLVPKHARIGWMSKDEIDITSFMPGEPHPAKGRQAP